MKNLGYYRFPTIHKNRLAFVCEDDLWLYDRRHYLTIAAPNYQQANRHRLAALVLFIFPHISSLA